MIRHIPDQKNGRPILQRIIPVVVEYLFQFHAVFPGIPQRKIEHRRPLTATPQQQQAR